LQKTFRNVTILALCQALFSSATSLMAAVAGLAGLALAADKALATLPISAMWVGTALSSLPASMGMRVYGRRTGFILGCAVGIGGALLAAHALAVGVFWQFVGSTFVIGAFVAHGQLYRFAAADTAPEAFRSRAISLVLAGGVIAGFLGPQFAKWSKDLVPEARYLGSYLVVAALCVVSIGMLALIDIPRQDKGLGGGPERPLAQVVRQPVYLVAVFTGMISYGVMILLMSGTPLSMVAHHHPFNDAATVIQWHVVGMFLPSFFTGHLIHRFGVQTMILAGAALDFACLGVALGGTTFLHYWLALMLLGVGWNFMFIGASTLLTLAHRPQERAKAQGLNDMLVFGTAVTASLLSGQLLHYVGWEMVLLAALPFVALSTLAVLWLAWRHGTVRLQA
jgi:MFS family permease